MVLDLDIQRMIAYESWANREALESIERAGEAAPPRARQIMAHIIGASHLWLARLQQVESPAAVWPESTPAEMSQSLAALHQQWRSWASQQSPGDLSRSIDYRNTKGEDWSNAAGDILVHLLLHSSYHRGQIATLLGRAGQPAAYTDFIHATRQGLI